MSFEYSGTIPAFSSSGSTHTLNIPLAGTGSTGLVSTQAQSFAGIKTFTNAVAITDSTGSGSYTTGALVINGGVGIGGVLEPLQAAPVIIEDNAFIGSRCIVVEGVKVGKEAVLGANVVLTASTKIIDVTGKNPIEFKGEIPSKSVVIPGSYTKKFPAGDFQVPCALIIGKRKESTDKKTSLNNALREYNISA